VDTIRLPVAACDASVGHQHIKNPDNAGYTVAAPQLKLAFALPMQMIGDAHH
jgi:hypothetical protein